MIAQVRSVYGSARSYPATTNTMLFAATSISCASSGIASIDSGGTFWFAAVKPRGRSGRSLLRSSKGGYHHPASCTLILNHAFTPLILHKNRMRRRARTGLSGGRSVMSVPTGSRWTGFVNTGRPVSLRFQFGGSSYGSVGEFGTADRSLWGPNRDSLQLLEVI